MARPRRWRMPSENPPTRRPAASRGRRAQHLVDAVAVEPAAVAVIRSWFERCAGMKGVASEQCADDGRRRGELSVWLSEHGGGAGGGPPRPSSIRRVVVLPAPLGPRNPVTRPRFASKLRLLHGGDGAVALRHLFENDGRVGHAAKLRSRRGAAIGHRGDLAGPSQSKVVGLQREAGRTSPAS